MVPDVAKKGHSFQGAFAYYLHDKLQERERSRDTAERVAWSETRNLATQTPEIAKRIMIATAMQADALKAAAGVKATGRKSNAHVYAYSLAWHPDEAGGLDRAEMVRAADASLQVLGAAHLQAVIVAHTDRKHPHVHIIVNRIDPETGKMHGFQNDHRQLDAWALAYEEARGRILTPARVKNKRAKAPELLQAQPEQPTPSPPKVKSQAQQLRERGVELKRQHAVEWQAFAGESRQARAEARAQRPSFKTISEQHREDTRADWRFFGKSQASERREFFRSERTLMGAIGNAVQAARLERLSGSRDEAFVWAVLRHALDVEGRHAVFAAYQAERKAIFAKRMNKQRDDKIAAAMIPHAERLAGVEAAIAARHAELRARQDKERAALREAWTHYGSQRKAPLSWTEVNRRRKEQTEASRSSSTADQTTPGVSAWRRAAMSAPDAGSREGKPMRPPNRSRDRNGPER